jgi:hypothetical protein
MRHNARIRRERTTNLVMARRSAGVKLMITQSIAWASVRSRLREYRSRSCLRESRAGLPPVAGDDRQPDGYMSARQRRRSISVSARPTRMSPGVIETVAWYSPMTPFWACTHGAASHYSLKFAKEDVSRMARSDVSFGFKNLLAKTRADLTEFITALWLRLIRSYKCVLVFIAGPGARPSWPGTVGALPRFNSFEG